MLKQVPSQVLPDSLESSGSLILYFLKHFDERQLLAFIYSALNVELVKRGSGHSVPFTCVKGFLRARARENTPKHGLMQRYAGSRLSPRRSLLRL